VRALREGRARDGIAEREIRIAKRQGQLLAVGLRWLFAELALSEVQSSRLSVLLPAMLRALSEGRAPEIDAPS
jgi:hypothetical protein